MFTMAVFGGGGQMSYIGVIVAGEVERRLTDIGPN